jgi:hypothetical protein
MRIVLTHHAQERLRRRDLSEEEIIDAVKHPASTIKKYSKYFYQKKLDRGLIEVCCEKTEKNIKIITVYWV